MTKAKRTLSQQDYHKAVGLFALTNDHYQRAFEAEKILFDLLGVDRQGGIIGDAVTTSERNSIREFNEALKAEGISVAAKKKRP